jgi:hypothetical protein
MTKLALALIACGTALVPLLSPAPTHAQGVRTWVSSTGSDANPCTRASPCQAFAGALPNTTINGEINCVDAGFFGGTAFNLVINKSVTIDCHDVFAGMSFCAAPMGGVVITIPVSQFDPLRTVRLRNLNINGINAIRTVL